MDTLLHRTDCMCRECREEYGESPIQQAMRETKRDLEEAMAEEWDAVNNVKHYQVFEGIEAIDIIKQVLTPQEFKGYCKGNALKYRLRAGKKDDVVQDINKAQRYEGML